MACHLSVASHPDAIPLVDSWGDPTPRPLNNATIEAPRRLTEPKTGRVQPRCTVARTPDSIRGRLQSQVFVEVRGDAHQEMSRILARHGFAGSDGKGESFQIIEGLNAIDRNRDQHSTFASIIQAVDDLTRSCFREARIFRGFFSGWAGNCGPRLRGSPLCSSLILFSDFNQLGNFIASDGFMELATQRSSQSFLLLRRQQLRIS